MAWRNKPGPLNNRVLLDSGDEEEDDSKKPEWSINKDYAKKYDDWRAKEEMQKLKDKYGADAEESSSSTSESEDEDAEALTPQIERDFFKTLAILKSDDPCIYDKSQKYFNEESFVEPATGGEQAKGSKTRPMFLKDYERKVLLEQDGVVNEGADQATQRFQSSYDQEQADLKRRLIALAHDDSDEGEMDDLLVERPKSQSQLQKEEDDYAVWLRSQDLKEDTAGHKKNEALKPLKDFWSDPTLEDGEKFLRDYLLDKKYVEKDKDRIPSYGEIVEDEHFSEEEEELEKAEEFEQKYNFRYEEPDPDFIKRFPRTLADSLRRKDDKRKLKRDEIKERKDTEKERVREDIKQLKSLKRREIMQKLDKLKLVSGNEELGFGENDLDGDFDPNTYDVLMKKVFNEEYYGGDEMEKPNISDESDLDENFAEDRQCEDGDEPAGGQDTSVEAAESRPSTSHQLTGKRKRRTKVSEAVQQAKPVFDPHSKKLEEYLDEYYKLDFEDVVAGIPCRFKYRSVMPNDFGLTAEEILLAPDRELNAWCSLKKTVQHRSQEEEMYDVRAYRQKAALRDIKLKIIPSLAEAEENSLENVETVEKKKRRRKKEKKDRGEIPSTSADPSLRQSSGVPELHVDLLAGAGSDEKVEVAPSTAGEAGFGAKKRRRKSKKPVQDGGDGAATVEHSANGTQQKQITGSASNGTNQGKKQRNRKKRKELASGGSSGGSGGGGGGGEGQQPVAKKLKTSYDHQQFVKALPSTRISDERLKAYGLNPKKHRAKEKYVLMAKAKTSDD